MLPYVDLEQRQLVGPGIDIIGLVRYLIEKLLGSDSSYFLEILSSIWNVYSIIAIILSAIFFAFFVYAKSRYGALSDREQELLREAEKKWEELYGTGRGSVTGRWAEIQAHLAENNPNSWKIAIIEADIFLDSVLIDQGYVGVTIGDKLKSANTASFTTIQDAWEAHKVRNQISHAGENDFILTRRLAEETLLRYERVFREFGAI
jgi:hypothetical protein